MEKTNYATPGADFGPYQDAFDTKLDMFRYMMAHQPLGKQFAHHMGGYRQGRPSWMDPTFYPVEERLFEGVDTTDDTALLVDVGGSFGHDLEEFRCVAILTWSHWSTNKTSRSKYPNAPGRLVLQDLPDVIDSIQNLHPKIERMKHDFLTEQPVKGMFAN